MSRVLQLLICAAALGVSSYSDESTPLSDYEEKQWLLRASEIARMVFRENAVRIYRL